jgi:hypothetical protein
MKDDARPSYWKMGMEELWCFPRQGAWILAISREIARLDQWRIVPKKDLWAVAGAWKELAGVVGRPRKRPHSGNEKNARVGTAVVINDQKRQVGRSAGRQVGRSAGRQVGRSAGRQ